MNCAPLSIMFRVVFAIYLSFKKELLCCASAKLNTRILLIRVISGLKRTYLSDDVNSNEMSWAPTSK